MHGIIDNVSVCCRKCCVLYGHCSICRLDALRFVYMRDFSQTIVGEWVVWVSGWERVWVTKCGV